MPLIVLEGIDGCGKTTQARLLAEALSANQIPHRLLREPGGTSLGESQRKILLDPQNVVCPVAELFGYLQARAQLVDEVLKPALAAKEVVILDRFSPSTYVYQGSGLGLDLQLLSSALRLAEQGVKPDLVLWLKIDPLLAAKRRQAGRAAADRIEARGETYLRKVHDGYAALAAKEGFTVINAEHEPNLVFTAISKAVASVLPEET